MENKYTYSVRWHFGDAKVTSGYEASDLKEAKQVLESNLRQGAVWGTIEIGLVNTITLTREELFERIREANHLNGRQRITDMWSNGEGDKWVFDSNAKGGYGETLTFHYATDEDLLKDIAPNYTTITEIHSNRWEITRN